MPRNLRSDAAFGALVHLGRLIGTGRVLTERIATCRVRT